MFSLPAIACNRYLGNVSSKKNHISVSCDLCKEESCPLENIFLITQTKVVERRVEAKPFIKKDLLLIVITLQLGPEPDRYWPYWIPWLLKQE